MKTKRLSLLLAFIMILSEFSGTFVVNAETPATDPTLTAKDNEEIAKGNEWKIGDTYYADWKSATAVAAESTEPITLYLLTDTEENLADNNSSGLYFAPKAAVTITGVTQDDETKPVMKATGYRWFTVTTGQAVTVQNIEVLCGTAGAFQVNTAPAALILKDMDIISNAVPNGVIILNAANTNLTVTDSNITIKNHASTNTRSGRAHV